MRLPQTYSLAVIGALLLLGVGQTAQAQSGSFIIPLIRPSTHADGGTDFAYWDLFERPPGSLVNYNYNYANPPALFGGLGMGLGLGLDADDNPTTAFAPRATLWQTGTDTAFLTGSAAIYSFAEPTAFEVPYSPPAESMGEVTNVIFQTMTGGSGLDSTSMLLSYEDSGGQTHTVGPVFRAQDDPQSGAFSERTITAFQWNLTGLGIRDFKIVFHSAAESMTLWESQLDVVVGKPFTQQLGYLLDTRARPLVRFGRPGRVTLDAPPGTDERFILPGVGLTLVGTPESQWVTAGWVKDGVVTAGPTLPLTMPAEDVSVTVLFAPTTYATWRTRMFFHFNGLLGTENDYTNDAISAPDVDHDHDGLDNHLEYAFGCDPYTPDAARAVQPQSTVVDGGQIYPSITYRTNGMPVGQSTVSYRVQLSTDLATWADNVTSAGTTVEVSRVLQADGTTLVTERATQPIETFNRCFMQVVAE